MVKRKDINMNGIILFLNIPKYEGRFQVYIFFSHIQWRKDHIETDQWKIE